MSKIADILGRDALDSQENPGVQALRLLRS
jgi:hypothetical protein